MRDMPRKIMLARRGVRGDRYDVVHAADWPFFIPVALSRWRDAGAGIDDGAWHRDQRDADAAEAHGDTRRRRVRAADGDRRQQPLYRDAVPRAVCRRPRQDQRDQSRRIGILVRRATETPRGPAGLSSGGRPAGDDHGRADHAPQRTSPDACRTVAASGRSAPSHHMARDRTGRRSRLCRRTATGCRVRRPATFAFSARSRTRQSAISTRPRISFA